MECEEIKKIIPKYFQHTASDEEIQSVEEHLCVCHDCRTVLGELMDKASEASETVEISSPDQAEIPSENKIQEEIKEKKEDMEYFPGEDIETALDKVDDVLGKPEPAKGDSGDKADKTEPIIEEKEDKKDEDSSFEIIDNSADIPHQEPITEGDTDALDIKAFDSVVKGSREPEEKAELPLEEEKIELIPEEETKEEKAEGLADEDSSFEIIKDPPVEQRQEFPTERDIEALDKKDFNLIGEEPKESEETIEIIPEEEKKEEKAEGLADEDSSFEIIDNSADIPHLEPVAESDADALDIKAFDSAVEGSEQPEEKAELPLEEEKIELISEEEKKEEKKEEKEKTFEPAAEKDILFKEEIPEEPVLKEENTTMSLEEDKESKESLEEVPYSLDQAPLDKKNAGLFEYLCLVAGLGVLGFLAYLLLKG